MGPPIRDSGLLDALEQMEQEPFSGTVWRSVREGRDPTECSSAGGRWDDRSFDVLYTSEAREGAIEERRFHLFRGQPFPPSLVRYEMFELFAELTAVISLDSLESLQAVGMNTNNYGKASHADRVIEYPRSQEIAEACFFLGADGILVPSARHASRNLVIFCEQEKPMKIELVRSHGFIDWAEGQP